MGPGRTATLHDAFHCSTNLRRTSIEAARSTLASVVFGRLPLSPSRHASASAPAILRAETSPGYRDWQRMIDHVAAVVLVMLIRLDATVRILGPGQQGVSSRPLRDRGGWLARNFL
jgi:hypothetical protein